MNNPHTPETENTATASLSKPTWFAYVAEFRQRLIYAILFYVTLTLPLIYFSSDLYTLLSSSFYSVSNPLLIATDVITPFTVPLKLAMVLGMLLSAPFFLYQIWQFVSPGLFAKEKKPLIYLILLSVCLFYSGSALAYFVVCPMTLSFFHHIAPSNIQIMTDIQAYLNFVLSLVLAFGMAFQVPIITWVLIRCRITTPEALKAKRPYVIVLAFVIGMLLTPPDVISQICLAIPLILLFESGLWLSQRLSIEPESDRPIIAE